VRWPVAVALLLVAGAPRLRHTGERVAVALDVRPDGAVPDPAVVRVGRHDEATGQRLPIGDRDYVELTRA
jgi:hypothetical protein